MPDAEPLPILVGLSGKRDLRGLDEEVRSVLRDVFRRLEEAFPDTPMVLVTGMAEGADMLAADLVLERLGWWVCARLPMPLETYLATMGTEEAREQCRRLLAHKRVMRRDLPTLQRPAGQDRPKKVSAPSEPADDASLQYEQLGIWLAEHSTVLIVVRDKASAGQDAGGTERVLRHRRDGVEIWRDDITATVLNASPELACRSALDPPARASAWTVMLPGDADDPVGDGIIIGEGDAAPVPEPNRRMIHNAFPVARGIDRYNKRIGVRPDRLGLGTSRDASEILFAFQTSIERVQARAQRRWRRTVVALACLFVIAVAILEVHAKLSPYVSALEPVGVRDWGMAMYVGLVALAGTIFSVARWQRFQAEHEDYRGVSELLRVQRAWWQAGCSGPGDHADLWYLIGARGTLSRVRRGAGAVITWARLLGRAPPVDLRAVYQDPGGFLLEQQAYFAQRVKQRHAAMHRVQVRSWFCFFAAAGIAAWLALHTPFAAWFDPLLHGLHTLPIGFSTAVGLLVAAAVLCGLAQTKPRYSYPGYLVAAAGLICAVPLAFGMYDFGVRIAAGADVHDAHHTAHAVVVITLVLLLAVSGAIRFAAEKLAWETEALAYGEARERFERAGAVLAAIDASAAPEESKVQQKQAVIRELGRRALAENEAWLRAHRERPIEPVLGG
ncbi:MAG: hypothetical protein AB7F35_14140 [Acetobacteraceae bacterium]